MSALYSNSAVCILCQLSSSCIGSSFQRYSGLKAYHQGRRLNNLYNRIALHHRITGMFWSRICWFCHFPFLLSCNEMQV